MEIDELCKDGVEKIKNSGETSLSVATDAIGGHWSELSDESKRQLAVFGLARLINDQMGIERARGNRERAEGNVVPTPTPTPTPHSPLEDWQAIEKRRREETKRRKDPAYVAEMERVHSASCCFHYGDRVCDMVRRDKCVMELTSGRDVRTIGKEELESLISERASYQSEIERCHRESYCPCQHSNSVEDYLKRKECVLRYITKGRDPRQVPQEELAARIEKESRINREGGDRLRGIIQVAGEIFEEYGYQKAIDNMRSIMLISSDGSMKSLMDFTLSDVRQWSKKSKANVISWKARKEFFGAAEQMLTDAGVDCVCDLPQEKIGELAKQAESIWKKSKQAAEAV